MSVLFKKFHIKIKLRRSAWVILPVALFSILGSAPMGVYANSALIPYFNMIQNLTANTEINGVVVLNWNSPEPSNTDVYAYAVSFYDLDEIGGTQSGGWGIWTTNTSLTLEEYMFSGNNPITTGFGPVRFEVKAGNSRCFSSEGEGDCLYGPETIIDAIVVEPGKSVTAPFITTTTSVPQIPAKNGCGPYNVMTVTGTTGGTVWGSGPYTDDSSFGAAAVHAGLIKVGETATIEPYEVDNYYSYYGSYLNGVYTNDWGSSWCGYQIKILGQESPTTTIVDVTTGTTSTTVKETTTTTIFQPTTPTTEVEQIETSTSTSNPENIEPASSLPQYAPEIETPEIQEITVPEDVQTQTDNTVDDIFENPATDKVMKDAVDELITEADKPEEFKAVVTSLLKQDLSDEQFSDVIDSVFAEPLSDEDFSSAVNAIFENTFSMSEEQFDKAITVIFDEPLSVEQFSAALDVVFEEPLSDEKFNSVINAVLEEPLSDEQFEELVNVLESETITEQQVSMAVNSVIENGVTEDQAVDLATSEKVLQSIDGEQASEIFNAVEISNVSQEDALKLVEAVQDAPIEVKKAFEAKINVFDGVIDTYVPLGSYVDISTRRVLIAAVSIATSISVSLPPASPVTPFQPSGGGGPPTNENNTTTNRRRR